MRFFIFLSFFLTCVASTSWSQSAEQILENGVVRASMPFEGQEYVGFQLLLEYNEELHVCIFKVVSDIQEFQYCEKLEN